MANILRNMHNIYFGSEVMGASKQVEMDETDTKCSHEKDDIHSISFHQNLPEYF